MHKIITRREREKERAMATAPDTHPVGRPADGTTLTDVGTGTEKVGDGPPTRQLDFYQAMRDFKLMFPNMDEDVIEAVLRANNGAVDDTIDQLLTMNVDSDGRDDSKETPSLDSRDGRDGSPIYMNQDLMKMPTQKALSSASSSEVGSPPQYRARFDPPSYNDCLSSSTPGLSPSKAKSSPSHSATASKTTSADVRAAMDSPSHAPVEEDSARAELEGAIGYTPNRKDQTPEKALLKKSLGLDEDFTPPPTQMPPMMSLLNHDYTGRAHSTPSLQTRTKKRYRDWNPPMLGTLPDDFLRFTLTPPTTPERHVHRTHSLHSTPEHHHPHPPHHPHHHSPPAAAPAPHVHTHHHRGLKASPQRSMSTAHPHTHHRTKSPQVGRSQSLRNEPGTITVISSKKNPNLRTVTATHGSEEISSNIIQRKIMENERARSLSTEMTPEQAQFLEDERLALLTQSEEFLQVLRRDADFMKTLERDRMNATAFESPNLDPNRPPPDQIEGYGTDNQAELGAFPFSQPQGKDENAEFRRQLSHMGGLSKKKFAALAKKFFTRKKKQKKVLKDSAAPSTANLLEDDDTDDEIRDIMHPETSPGYNQ